MLFFKVSVPKNLKDNASNLGVFLAFLAIVPFISLGYSSLKFVLQTFVGGGIVQDDVVVVLITNLTSLNIFWAVGLSLVSLVLTLQSRHLSHLLVPVCLFLLWRIGDIDPDPNGSFRELISAYILCSVAIVTIILSKGKLSYPLTCLIIFLLLLEAITGIFGLYMPIFSVIYDGYAVSSLNILIFLIVIFAIRSGVKVLNENGGIFTNVNKDERRRLHKQTLILWWPMGLIFLIFTVLNFYLQYALFNPFVIQEIERERMNLGRYDAVPITDKSPMNVTEALNGLITAKSDAFVVQVDKASVEIDKATQTHSGQIVPLARSKMPRRFPGTTPVDCSWYNIVCHLKNGIKSMINSGYVSAREEMLSDINDSVKKAQTKNTQHNKAFAAELKKGTARLTSTIKLRVFQAGTTLALLSWFLLFYSLIILTKSYFVVFSRVFYKQHSISRQEDGDENSRIVPGKIKVLGNQATIDAMTKNAFFFTFKVLGPNAIDRRRIPQMFALILARIARGKYMLCKIEPNDDSKVGAVEIKVDDPGEIVEWEIKESQEVFVNLSDLVGFEETCKLGWRISFHISSLVFGRVIYYSVKGPGRIYLVTTADALSGNDQQSCAVMHASSLVAWSRNAEFKIESSLSKVDVFFSGYSISKADKKRYLVAYDKSQKRRVGSGRGIWRMVRTFLLPI